MHIDHDYVRQLLLEAEEQTNGKTNFEFNSPVEDMSPEEFERQRYHLNFMIKAGYLEGNDTVYWDLTPEGHRFAALIRSDNAWSKFKKTAGQVGGFTVTELIKMALNLGLNSIA